MSGKRAKIERQYALALERVVDLHARALACHCECLGMNAENALACCRDTTPPFGESNYDTVMQKWGLMNEKGESLI